MTDSRTINLVNANVAITFTQYEENIYMTTVDKITGSVTVTKMTLDEATELKFGLNEASSAARLYRAARDRENHYLQ
jgi:hypothetical protein